MSNLITPKNFNQANAPEEVYQLRENAGNKSYIEIQNAPSGTRLFDITDPGNVVTIGNDFHNNVECCH